MKKYTIAFWITAAIIFLFEGVLTVLTSQSDMAKQGIAMLGYPAYFGAMLVVFKALGSLALIIPKVPARVKEWAFAGFGFDFIAATVSIWAVGGFSWSVLFPVLFIAILAVCYVSYHQMLAAKSAASTVAA